LYRRRGVSHTLSHRLSHSLSHMTKRPLPEPDSKLIGSLLIPYQSRDAVCV
jgi:hypothetical protein